MTYILILVLTSTYGGTPLGTTSAEFATEANCKAAIETIKQESQNGKDGVMVRGAYCVRKGRTL